MAEYAAPTWTPLISATNLVFGRERAQLSIAKSIIEHICTIPIYVVLMGTHYSFVLLIPQL